MATWFDALGSGQVDFHPDRELIHFGTQPEEAAKSLALRRLAKRGFETTERMPEE